MSRVFVLKKNLTASSGDEEKKNSVETMSDYGNKMLANNQKSKKRTTTNNNNKPRSLWNADPEKADITSAMQNVRGKTVFLAGASRGIGKAIALKLSADGANVVITGKTTEPHPTLPGTIFTAAEECKKAGASGALPVVMNVRDEESVQAAVKKAVDTFGGIDIVFSCASAIFPQPLGEMDSNRYDLMMSVNTRGTMMVLKATVPYLVESATNDRNPHVVILSPPLDFERNINATNYMVAKGGMTLAAMFGAIEFRRKGVAFNTLWPTGLVTTSALNHLFSNDPEKLDAMMRSGRTPQCQADAAYAIVTSHSRKFTGNQCIDEDVLRKRGENDFTKYDYMTLGATRDERLAGILAQ